jgi:hypothetical protein
MLLKAMSCAVFGRTLLNGKLPSLRCSYPLQSKHPVVKAGQHSFFGIRRQRKVIIQALLLQLTLVMSSLRVASTHLRQHDSWKIISRIRKIYEGLPTHHKRVAVQQRAAKHGA